MWIEIIEDDYETYPNEGIVVLVSDGINYDVAYYVMSGTYKWLKETNVEEEVCEYFTSFKPLYWELIKHVKDGTKS